MTRLNEQKEKEEIQKRVYNLSRHLIASTTLENITRNIIATAKNDS